MPYPLHLLSRINRFVRVIEENCRGATMVSVEETHHVLDITDSRFPPYVSSPPTGHHRNQHVSPQVQKVASHQRIGRGQRKVYHLFVPIRGGQRCAAFAVHASVPQGLCRPVADDEQALSDLSGRHRNASEQSLTNDLHNLLELRQVFFFVIFVVEEMKNI
jgi:hypothetical protein